jgi:uncharacterized membrane protein YphA (DoxX/SURF4 family)
MEEFFDRLHASARRISPLYRLAVISRLLLALAFIPTGMVKVLGQRFTSIGTEHPVGAFFEAMYQTGPYWNFLGLGQVLSGVLILIPVTSTLGAVMFFPIILNITVLTWAIQFKGTVYVTALMLLANTFLLCWDYDRWRGILFAPADRAPRPAAPPMPLLERAGYAIGGAAAMMVVLSTRGFVSRSVAEIMFFVGVFAAVLVVAGWIQAARRSPSSRVIPSNG